jgi:hypothetical protein
MPHPFLSDAWFDAVDTLIAAAGDLHLPPAMKDVELNVTIVSPDKQTEVFLKDGLFKRGHKAGVPTTITLDAGLARKLFVDADAAAGVQAFLSGELKVEGDLAKVVAMQTAEPSEQQKQLAKRIATITA